MHHARGMRFRENGDLSIIPFLLGLDDFNNTVLTITFDADEDAPVFDADILPIPIIDDVINEAMEQLMVVQLSLVSSLNPAGVNIVRPTTVGRITDNDRKYLT